MDTLARVLDQEIQTVNEVIEIEEDLELAAHCLFHLKVIKGSYF